MTTLRTRPIVALLIALLILFALSGAVYALGRALGYIPGVGLVDPATIRLLAEPVTETQQGVSITVSKIVADSTRTFISYSVKGIPFVENQIPACMTAPELHLPDGTNLEDRTGSGGTGVRRDGDTLSYGADGLYAPIPAGIDRVILAQSCTLPGGSGLLTFALNLDLVPAPEGYATPAVEMAITPQVVENKSGLQLQKVVELSGSYLLIGKFIDAGDLSGPLYMTTSSDSDYLPHIEDANGAPVSFKVRDDARPDPDWDNAYYWAYEVAKPVVLPLTITVDQVNTRRDSTVKIPFDTGANPQAGQEWTFDQTVTMGEYQFTLDKITFLENGYQFDLSHDQLPPTAVFSISLVDHPANPFQFDGNDNRGTLAGNQIVETITLKTNTTPPSGALTVELQLEEAIPQSGPWSLTWKP